MRRGGVGGGSRHICVKTTEAAAQRETEDRRERERREENRREEKRGKVYLFSFRPLFLFLSLCGSSFLLSPPLKFTAEMAAGDLLFPQCCARRPRDRRDDRRAERR